MTANTDLIPKGYSRTTGPCPQCKLKGYVGNNPEDTCRLCNGGGWYGRFEKVKK